VPRLLSLGADPNAREIPYIGSIEISETPLLMAVSARNEELVQQLLDHGADINAKVEKPNEYEHCISVSGMQYLSPVRVTAIQSAALAGHQAAVELLRRNGADTRELPLPNPKNLNESVRLIENVSSYGWNKELVSLYDDDDEVYYAGRDQSP
jgi:ankyrin repeat protein